jgi:peptidoglycan/LPS O-acetylase OafA/YrhL
MLLVKPDSKASRYLDLLRFLAALAVLMLHATANHQVPGYQSVMVFFVLSGYLIGITVLKPMRENRWSWKHYLTNRITRLWVVLIPALLLTLLWNELQISMFGPDTFQGFRDGYTWFGNLFFLQKITVAEFGDNGPLWSLSYEFWYYILFPCLMLVYFSKTWTARVLYGLFSLGLALFLGKYIMAYFLIWLLGVLIAFLRPVHLRGLVKYLILGASVIVFTASLKIPYTLFHISTPIPEQFTQYLPDLMVAAAFAVMVYLIICLYNEPLSGNRRMMDTFKYGAGFSYTLYLVHQPVLHFLVASRSVEGSLLNTPDPLLQLVLKAAVFLGILVYAWLLSRVTEARTDQVRKWLLHRTRNWMMSARVRTTRL